MPFSSELRTDLLDASYLENPEKVKIIAESQYKTIVADAVDASTTPGPAKSIVETMELIRLAIADYEERHQITEDAHVGIVYDKPDKDLEVETVSLSIYDRRPGSWSQGAPMEGKVKNLKPLLREEIDDPDNPGYKRAVLGYYYDNILRLTAWARTNKAANDRALWVEQMMEEYTWYFRRSGVARILFHGWRQNETVDINGNKYYGRPIDYYVRTERLWNLSQKTLEQIWVYMAVGPQSSTQNY